MGARVAAAKHLGELLTESKPRVIKRPAYQSLLTDFQKDFLGAKADLLAARRQLDAAGKAAF